MKSDELPNQQPQRPSSGHAIPEHWKVIKLRGILRKTNERNRPDWPLLSVVREQGVILRNIEDQEENHNFIPDDLSNYKVVRKGQFAMNKMKAWQGSYGISPLDGIVSPAYFVFDVKGVTEDFFNRAIRSRAYVTYFARASDGVRIGQWDLSPEQMREIPILVPPYNEQTAIVRFLDHADEQIQYYIAGKERLIALLEEQRQALVHQAVTQGLDPNVRLKPSGVEWLEDVPEHWELRRIRSLAAIGTGDKDTINRDVEGKYPFFVRSQNVERIDTWSFDGEAVLTAGDGAGVGKVFHYFNGKFDFHQRVYKFSDFKDILGKFFYYSLKASLPYLTQQGTAKSTVDSLRLPMLQNIKTTVPPSEEQEELTRYLEQAEHRIDYAVAQAHRQIDLMTEYRTQLIADVVTGQLDVRKAAAQLPAAP